MKYQIIICILLLKITVACKESDPVRVFISGMDGHKSYRIPAITNLNDGTVLAFAEGRVNGSNDFGDINIVLKRSSDNGKTWGSLVTVVDYDSLQAGNTAPVADLADPDYPGGRIFLFYNTGNNHENEVRKGNGFREVWYKTSVDKGITWSDPVNITAQVHRIKKLPDPVCQGSIINFGKYKGKHILAFSNASDIVNRNNLKLRFSYDDGISWTHEITIDKSDDPANMNDYTAYSDLVKLPSGRVGILYERNNYSEIVFMVIKPGTKYN